VRRLGLAGTELARAQVSTLRLRLFKVAGLVQISVRRVYVRLASGFPLQELLATALQRLRGPVAGATASG
jgi:type IV secretory pathway VirB2 component (pilin)